MSKETNTLELTEEQAASVAKYALTDEGFKRCMRDNEALSIVARNLVFDYLQHGWKVKSEEKKKALQDTIDFAGFNMRMIPVMIGGQIKWRYTHTDYKNSSSYIDFRYNLFSRFKSELKGVNIDTSDGLLQECAEVANIVAKYKHVLKLEKEKLNRSGWSVFTSIFKKKIKKP